MRQQRISQEEFNGCRCSTTYPVDQETMKKNASRMLNSFLFVQKDLEQDSGIVAVQIVDEVSGTKWRRRCCWNSQKADIQFSVLQVHCPEVNSKAKAMENCRYTVVPIWRRLKLFFA